MEERLFYYINSKDRISGTPENFNISLQLPPNNKYDKIAMSQIAIPKSYFLLDSSQGNNHFQLDENGTVVDITVAQGCYNQVSLATAIKNALDAQSPLGWTYTVQYDNPIITGNTGLYVYGVSGNSGVQPIFTFTSDDMSNVMGFATNSTNTFVGDALTSTQVIKLQRYDVINLRSDICVNYGNDVIYTVPVNAVDFSYISAYNPNMGENCRDLESNKSLIYNFRLTDASNRDIDLNGLDYNFVLCIFRKSRIEEILRLMLNLTADTAE